MFGLALAPLFLSACASTTWQGAEQEAIYDKALETARATQVLNNDDYYEIHRDNRIYGISDVKDLKTFTDSGELPFRVTRIAGNIVWAWLLTIPASAFISAVAWWLAQRLF